jgi:hypothetical protein
MKQNVNGVEREMTPAEIAEFEAGGAPPNIQPGRPGLVRRQP